MNRAFLLALLLVLANPLFAESKFMLGFSGAYDSNPTRASNADDGGMGAALKAEYQYGWAFARNYKLFFKGAGEMQQFEGGADNANNSKLGIDAGIRLKPKVAGKRLYAKLGIAYKRDKHSYISHRTGDLATFSGTSIGERYESDKMRLYSRLSYRVLAQLKLTLKSRFVVRDYLNDYENLGMERLDYQQWMVEPGLAYDLTKRLTLSLSAPIGERAYENRRAQDISGNAQAGTDLEYRYRDYKVKLDYDLNKFWGFSAGYLQSDRTDGFEGYKDRIKKRPFLTVDYKPSDTAELELRLSLTDNDYSNLADENSDGADISNIDSFRLRFSQHINDFEVTVEARITRRDNMDAGLAYDRDHLLFELTRSF